MNRFTMTPTTSVVTAFLSVLMCNFFVKGEENGSLSVSAALEEKLKNYDKRMTPAFGTGSPVMVEARMYVMDISSFNEETMDFSLTCFLQQRWKDPRLAGIDVPGWNREVVHDSEIIQRIWTPDTYFDKDKETVLRETVHPNSAITIFPDGRVVHRVRVTTRTACSMDLRYFPMDTQRCSIGLSSFGYTVSDARYKWGPTGIGINIQLMRYKLVGYSNHPEKYIVLPQGNFSHLDMTFSFSRDMGYYFLNMYLPSALLVLLSCFSYWLGPYCTYARGVLNLTCVLAVTTLVAGSDEALPAVSYIRAIDVYIITCFFLVLLALAQYVIIQHMSPPSNQRYDDIAQASDRNDEQQLSSFQLDASLLKTTESRATKADKYAKYIVPSVFCVFNFLYWTIYLNVGDFHEEYNKYPEHF